MAKCCDVAIDFMTMIITALKSDSICLLNFFRRLVAQGEKIVKVGQYGAACCASIVKPNDRNDSVFSLCSKNCPNKIVLNSVTTCNISHDYCLTIRFVSQAVDAMTSVLKGVENKAQ